MWLDPRSQAVIDEFWQRAGEIEKFPRMLERAIAFALPLTIVKLPRLRLWDIEQYLKQRGVLFQFDIETRAVRGCLIAYAGKGIIFLDGTDPEDEQRITVAHETAHFLIDYQIPRAAAIEKLGATILEVLDGHRLPSLDERVYASLRGQRLGLQVDLMERNTKAGSTSVDVWKIEDRADRIALFLLAPPQDILCRVNLELPRFQMRHAEMTRVLRESFGLPHNFASSYAWNLLHAAGKGQSWVEHFRLA